MEIMMKLIVFVLGVFVGIVLMCLMQVNRDEE
ncbi:MAG: DUF3789 domain-containing protein [Erysipelotrichaceae bacterium]|nr:DUF3789 domain-containing protein [Erysipelotrichaceae bacterium]